MHTLMGNFRSNEVYIFRIPIKIRFLSYVHIVNKILFFIVLVTIGTVRSLVVQLYFAIPENN